MSEIEESQASNTVVVQTRYRVIGTGTHTDGQSEAKSGLLFGRACHFFSKVVTGVLALVVRLHIHTVYKKKNWVSCGCSKSVFLLQQLNIMSVWLELQVTRAHIVRRFSASIFELLLMDSYYTHCRLAGVNKYRSPGAVEVRR